MKNCDSSKLSKTVTQTATCSHGLTFQQLNTVFPFHLRINSGFIITQVGDELNKLFTLNEETKKPVCIGRHIGDIFNVVSPILFKWDNARLKIAKNMNFKFEIKNKNLISTPRLPLIGGVVISDPKIDKDCTEQSALFLLSLNISDARDLSELSFTFSQLNHFAFQNEVVLANEHLESELKLMRTLEETKKNLEHERSKTLVSLYFLLL